MGTTLAELRRKVLMGIKDLGGEDLLMADEAINQACQTIAEVQDFEEMIVLDITSAATVHGTKRYSLTTDLDLVRPKSIFSIVAHDDTLSTKLKFVAFERVDQELPYPEQIAEKIPTHYTRQGDFIELYPIPDAVYPLYIRYSQWPVVMSADTDTCSYSKLDRTVIALARDIFLSLRAGLPLDSYISKAKAYLEISTDNDRSNPDALPIARPYATQQFRGLTGEYWLNPFIQRG